MRTFLLLTRVQMLGLLNSLAPVKSGLSHNQRTLRVVGIAAAAILLGLLFVAYLGLMAVGLALVGLARILPALAVMLGSLAGVVFTFFKANGTLFGFKDYDLVMSLPVSRRMVVASRMATIMGMALVIAVCAMAPLYVVYFLAVPSGAISVTAAVLSVAPCPARSHDAGDLCLVCHYLGCGAFSPCEPGVRPCWAWRRSWRSWARPLRSPPMQRTWAPWRPCGRSNRWG